MSSPVVVVDGLDRALEPASGAHMPLPAFVAAVGREGSSVRCLARLLAALAVLSGGITFPPGQSMSVPGKQPRQARSPQWRVDLALGVIGLQALPKADRPYMRSAAASRNQSDRRTLLVSRANSDGRAMFLNPHGRSSRMSAFCVLQREHYCRLALVLRHFFGSPLNQNPWSSILRFIVFPSVGDPALNPKKRVVCHPTATQVLHSRQPRSGPLRQSMVCAPWHARLTCGQTANGGTAVALRVVIWPLSSGYLCRRR